MKIAYAALAAVAALAATPVLAQTTQPIHFNLVNNTANTLTTLQIGESTNPMWGDDILGRDVLAPGESATVTINDNLSDCEYDVRATFTSGPEVDVRHVDMCHIDGQTVNVQ